MIGKLVGRLDGEDEGAVIVEVSGVGYRVHVPAGDLDVLRRAPARVSLLVHTAVREDSIDLYGFLTEEELSFFRLLMSVSGIGPKSALAILNSADVESLRRSIGKGDTGALTKVFGIGKKSAERIVVELRDKVAFTRPGTAKGGSEAEVLEALMGLGYSASESRVALKEIDPALEGTRERIAAALKHLGSAKAAL